MLSHPESAHRLKDRFAKGLLDCQRRLIDPFLHRHKGALSVQDMHRARILVALLVFGFLACTGMAAVRLVTAGWVPSTVVVAVAPLGIVAGLITFLRTGNIGLSGDLLVVTVLIIIGGTAFFDGGLYSRVLTWLPAIPLIANFTAARLTALRSSLLALVGLMMLLVAHKVQWITASDPNDPVFGRLLASFASMLFVSAVAYAYEDSRRRAEGEREALSRIYRDWVSVVSHELRTPLTSLYGGLKLITEGKLDNHPDKQQQLLRMTTKNAERLIHLVNDVLDVEQLNAGKLQLKREPIRLDAVIDEAIKTQQFFANERGVRLSVDSKDLPPVTADYNRVLQVAQNLISNAIKFSHDGDTVRVRFEIMDGGVQCVVEDHGTGVAEDFRGALFQRFSQQQSGSSRQAGGSGLGLFICKGIIDHHGGKIGYEDRQGKGSIFYFELPFEPGTIS